MDVPVVRGAGPRTSDRSGRMEHEQRVRASMSFCFEWYAGMVTETCIAGSSGWRTGESASKRVIETLIETVIG